MALREDIVVLDLSTRQVGGDIDHYQDDLDSTSETGSSPNDPHIFSHTPSVGSKGRRRNKPTLSCTACVGRKTKCDRNRPICFACQRRRSVCRYSETAEMLAIQDAPQQRRRSRKQAHKTMSVLPPAVSSSTTEMLNDSSLDLDSHIDDFVGINTLPSPSITDDLQARQRMTLGSPLAINFSQQHSTAEKRPALFNLFGMTSEHPFRNLWTNAGGLAEVIGVLPSKQSADLFVQKYFQIVDPIYPIIARNGFIEYYEGFWNATPEDKQSCDPAKLALQLAIFTIGAQYVNPNVGSEAESSSLFYLSCCHQCLCISSYLNQCSLATLQTMVLITNFLVSSHRVSDAWTFSGITQRQSYGLQLHRNPSLVFPDSSTTDTQVKCRLWLATMFQDTSLSLYLELPPATTHYETQAIFLDTLAEPEQPSWVTSMLPESSLPLDSDISFLKAMWQYTSFVQTHICINKALRSKICINQANKIELITAMQNLYEGFDAPFNERDQSRFLHQPERVARQLISLSSNFFYALTILYLDHDPENGVLCDVYGALEASHEAMSSFFVLARLFPVETDTWGASQTRAYTQATMIARVLVEQRKPDQGSSRDVRLMLAKSNLDHYIDILIRAQGSQDFDNVRKQKLASLQSLRDGISAV